MQFIFEKKRKFQQGGAMEAPAAPEEAQEEAQGQDPMMMLAQGAAQALQSQDCQMAMQVCQGLLQIIQQMSTPEPEQGEPVFQKGGKLLRRIKK